jgi:hypothetical protein
VPKENKRGKNNGRKIIFGCDKEGKIFSLSRQNKIKEGKKRNKDNF